MEDITNRSEEGASIQKPIPVSVWVFLRYIKKYTNKKNYILYKNLNTQLLCVEKK